MTLHVGNNGLTTTISILELILRSSDFQQYYIRTYQERKDISYRAYCTRLRSRRYRFFFRLLDTHNHTPLSKPFSSFSSFSSSPSFSSFPSRSPLTRSFTFHFSSHEARTQLYIASGSFQK